MNCRRKWCSIQTATVALLLCSTGDFSSGGPPDTVGQKIGEFALPGSDGKTWTLSSTRDSKVVVVVFLGTTCPINNAYMVRLAEVHRDFADKGVSFVGINANQQDTAELIRRHAGEHKLPFPVLKDESGRVADLFRAEKTPEAFVLDGARAVRYRGQIDDQFGVDIKRPKPNHRFLVEAIEEVLAGKPVSTPVTEAPGCYIARAPRPKAQHNITYTRDIARIFQKNCQECHRPGQIGPMPLLTYEDAASWADSIRWVVKSRRMPPWYADPKFGHFENDRTLPEKDRETILAWIEQGCPRGDDKDAPKPPSYSEGWRIGAPDAVFKLPDPIKVPATAPKGGVRYRYVFVSTNYDEDRWIQAVEAKPGVSAVVHHILVYVRQAGQLAMDRADGIGDGLLVAYAPGDLPSVFPQGMAKKLPKGAVLVFQMHYTPNGVEQVDQSSVGLVFSKLPPPRELKTRAVAQTRFSIPPGDGNHKVVASSTFRQDAVLVSLFPHMHLRGKSFQYEVISPDGKRETLLSVPRYNFDWQNNYRLAKPLALPAGSKIECTAYFDNSANNPNNPDPTKPVRWGEQTWEEMMIGFLDYYVVGNEKE
jgi:peroxiredoxin/mono/diheme cytochrome c family protein